MKKISKTIALLLVPLLALILLLSGCGSGDNSAPLDNMEVSSNTADTPQSPNDADDGETSQSTEPVISGGTAALSSEKIVYRASAEIQTETFDDTIEQVYAMLDQYLGFLESAEVRGSDYYDRIYDYPAYRSAEFVLRIPTDQYTAVTSTLDSLGAVSYLTTTAENVTAAYTDLEARLTSLRTKEERILSLLERAETMEDILTLEDKLNDVIYQIESLSTRRGELDSLINYSTIKLQIVEVREIVEPVDEELTYAQRLWNSFSGSVSAMFGVIQGGGIALAAALPALAVAAVIGVPALILYRRHRKNRDKTNKSAPEDGDGR